MIGTGDVKDEGDAISEGNHSAGRPLVRSVPDLPVEFQTNWNLKKSSLLQRETEMKQARFSNQQIVRILRETDY